MYTILLGILDWIKADYKTHPIRFVIEVVAWVLSIACALIMALTVPSPPLKYLYFPWVASTIMYAGCAYSRRSFGMLANYLLLAVIDGTALVKWWL